MTRPGGASVTVSRLPPSPGLRRAARRPAAAPAELAELSRDLGTGWPLLHCVEAQQFTREMLEYVFETADEMEKISKVGLQPRADLGAELTVV